MDYSPVVREALAERAVALYLVLGIDCVKLVQYRQLTAWDQGITRNLAIITECDLWVWNWRTYMWNTASPDNLEQVILHALEDYPWKSGVN